MRALAIDDAAWSSAWRHRSVAEKAFLAGGLLAVALTTSTVGVDLAIIAISVIAALGLARVRPATFAAAGAGPLIFIAIGAASIAITFDAPAGDSIWQFWRLSITPESLSQSQAVLLRSIAAVSATLLLITTTPVPLLLGGLRRLRVPAVVLELAALIYRMLFTTLATAGSMTEAQRARLGYSSLPRAYRSLGMLGSALFIGVWTRAQRWETGLAGRTVGEGRWPQLVTPQVDARFIVLTGLVLGVLMVWSLGWLP